MYLFELFADSDEDAGGLMKMLRQRVLDLLTPLAANGVPYVTIQQLVDKLSDLRTGISIDRDLIYNLLDPDNVNLVKSVEGDRIYLELPTSQNSDKEKKKKEDQIKQQEQHKRDTERQAVQQTAKENQPVKPVPQKDNGPLSSI